MADAPLVSVLVPLYNHEKYIVQCLDSILEDGYPAVEIIVVDDGSPDKSAERVRTWYADRKDNIPGRFEFITRENRGVSATLNELFEKSRGEYIAYLSSDDYLFPGGIAARVDYLQQHPSVKLVVGDYRVVDEESQLLHSSGIEALYHGRKRYLADEQTIAAELIFNWCLSGAIYLGRRELYSDYGYDEDLAIEDWDYCLRLAAAGLIGFIDHPVSAYRVSRIPRIATREREIQCTKAMLITARKNLPLFHGLPRIFLWAETLRYRGYLARLTGKNRLLALLILELGRMVMRLTKRQHHRNCP